MTQSCVCTHVCLEVNPEALLGLYLHWSATWQALVSLLYWELHLMFREICFYFTQTSDGNLNKTI